MSRKFLLLSLSILLPLIAPLFFASPARAECTYEGKTYQTGETVGPYVCTPDGTWKPL
jgi:hypothetical protein